MAEESSPTVVGSNRVIKVAAMGVILAGSLMFSMQSASDMNDVYKTLQGSVEYAYAVHQDEASVMKEAFEKEHAWIEGEATEPHGELAPESDAAVAKESFEKAAAWMDRGPVVEEVSPLLRAESHLDEAVIPKERLGETDQLDNSKAYDDAAHKPKEVEDMNIVFFYADDWTFRTLGLINPYVKTPHIDELARNGVLFRHNCVTTSICWQSRASMVTSMFVGAHRFTHIGSTTIFNETVPWPDTLYPKLRANGYHVGYVGKWHAPMPREFREYSFDHFNIYYGHHWMERQGQRRHVTELNGMDGLHYLRNLRPKGQKFALTIAFFATHAQDGKKYPEQYSPQPRTAYMYDNETDIPNPKTHTQKHWEDMPYFFDEGNVARSRYKERYNTPERFQVTMKRYYRMAAEVDDVVGDIIAELKAQGEYNRTLIIATTDNGMLHGEHGMTGKWYPHEESIRVPLIIQDPRMPDAMRGTQNDEFTLNIDLAPTMLAAAGVDIPPHMQGRDMAQLYLNPQEAAANWRKDFFYEWTQGSPVDSAGHPKIKFIPAVFALIRKDYKYFYWPQFQYEQVFHVEEDPFEEFDVFNSTAQSHAGILDELKTRYAHLKGHSQAGFSV